MRNSKQSYVVACFSLLSLACGDSKSDQHAAPDESADASTQPEHKPSSSADSGTSQQQPAIAGKSGAEAPAAKHDDEGQAAPKPGSAAGTGGSAAPTVHDTGQAHEE